MSFFRTSLHGDDAVDFKEYIKTIVTKRLQRYKVNQKLIDQFNDTFSGIIKSKYDIIHLNDSWLNEFIHVTCGAAIYRAALTSGTCELVDREFDIFKGWILRKSKIYVYGKEMFQLLRALCGF